MPNIEEEMIITAHAIRAMLEKIYRVARERRNEKVQLEIKEMLADFAQELSKGMDSKQELQGILEKQKEAFSRIKKELGIENEKTVDRVLEEARKKVKEQSKEKNRTEDRRQMSLERQEKGRGKRR